MLSVGNPKGPYQFLTEVQANGRIRHWAFISEVDKYLRVVTEPDGQTVHNAFFDRRFEP